jgi:hypothetical protein
MGISLVYVQDCLLHHFSAETLLGPSHRNFLGDSILSSLDLGTFDPDTQRIVSNHVCNCG